MNTIQDTNLTDNKQEPIKEINLRTLLESGAHFGSKKCNWNPRMAPFIYGSKKDIYIINLEKTVNIWNNIVRPFIVGAAAEGKTILFVGTKKQGRESLTDHAIRSNSPYVNQRWRAGLLTNFDVVKKSVQTLVKYEEIINRYKEGLDKTYTKQEINKFTKKVEKLAKDFNGLRNLKVLPDVIFVTDADYDSLAVEEAKKLNIPVIALADTNIDPTKINFLLPANDDAVKTLNLFTSCIAEAIIEGQMIYKAAQPQNSEEVQEIDIVVEPPKEESLTLNKEGKLTELKVEKRKKSSEKIIKKPLAAD